MGDCFRAQRSQPSANTLQRHTHTHAKVQEEGTALGEDLLCINPERGHGASWSTRSCRRTSRNIKTILFSAQKARMGQEGSGGVKVRCRGAAADDSKHWSVFT